MEDVRRIESLGYRIQDFAIPGKYSKTEVIDDKDWDYWWKNSFIKIEDIYFKLNMKNKENSQCMFLVDGQGCILGENRPFICRLYPFWINKRNHLLVYEPGEDYCYLIKNRVPLFDSVSLLHETSNSLKDYYLKIREDCIKNRSYHRQILISLLHNNTKLH